MSDTSIPASEDSASGQVRDHYPDFAALEELVEEMRGWTSDMPKAPPVPRLKFPAASLALPLRQSNHKDLDPTDDVSALSVRDRVKFWEAGSPKRVGGIEIHPDLDLDRCVRPKVAEEEQVATDMTWFLLPSEALPPLPLLIGSNTPPARAQDTCEGFGRIPAVGAQRPQAGSAQLLSQQDAAPARKSKLSWASLARRSSRPLPKKAPAAEPVNVATPDHVQPQCCFPFCFHIRLGRRCSPVGA